MGSFLKKGAGIKASLEFLERREKTVAGFYYSEEVGLNKVPTGKGLIA